MVSKTITYNFLLLLLIALLGNSCEEEKICEDFEGKVPYVSNPCFECEIKKLKDQHINLCHSEGEFVKFVYKGKKVVQIEAVDSLKDFKYFYNEDSSNIMESYGSINQAYYKELLDVEADSFDRFMRPYFNLSPDTINMEENINITFRLPVQNLLASPRIVINIVDEKLEKYYVRCDTIAFSEENQAEYQYTPEDTGVHLFVGWLIYDTLKTQYHYRVDETINTDFIVKPTPATRRMQE